jgi:hypothetical protein
MEHADVFFGRTRAIGALMDALAHQADKGCAFVLVFGMSGCGKSSLVRAGLLPTLTQLGVAGVDLWRWCVLRPSDATGDLYDGLALALLTQALPELEALTYDARALAALFRDAPQHAIAPIRAVLQRAAEAEQAMAGAAQLPVARLAVVVDQMEELFTLERVDTKAREGFIAALSALARSGLVWVIATMRSDFYPRCAELPELVALKEGAGQYDLLPPTGAEIGDMIRYPARVAGLRFEVTDGNRLDNILHEAAADNPTALPLLEFTLDELYKQREDGVLTFAAYQRLGGLEGALAQRAEEVFTGLPPAAQAALPAVLRALVTVGHSGEDIVAARRVPLASLTTTAARKTLLEAFIQARLLVTDRAQDGQAVVGIAHEALLHHWPRLQAWLAEDREFLRTRARVAEAAARWREEGKSIDFLLLQGKPLTEAEDLLARRRDDLDAEAVEYIETSITHLVRVRRKRRCVVASVTAAFFVVVSGFGVFSYRQRQLAEQQREHAEQQRQIAEERRQQTQRQLLAFYIEQGRQELLQGRRSRAAVYLSTAYDAGETSATLRFLLAQAMQGVDVQLATLTGHRSNVLSATFSPDGARIVTASADWTAKVWDAATGQLLTTLEGHDWVRSAAFSPDGTRIVTASLDRTAKGVECRE